MEINLSELIDHPENLNRDTLFALRNLVAVYPYFQTARLLFLKNLFLLHDPTFGEELRKTSLFVADRGLLFNMVEGDNYKIEPQPIKASSSNEMAQEGDRTGSLIDRFLSSRAEEPKRKPTAADATTDYMAYLSLDQEEEAIPSHPQKETDSQLNGYSLIDSFIDQKSNSRKLNETPQYTPEVNMRTDGEDEDSDEEFFTETLAKIYIKQGRYEKAIEIISKLNTNYPKKNSYFADQLRFLQKIVINNKYKK